MRGRIGIAIAAALSTTCVPAKDPPASARYASTREGEAVVGLPGAPAAHGSPIARSPGGDSPVPVDSPVSTLRSAFETPVVLVVLDGVRWQEVFGGVDPRLAAGRDVGPRTDARGLLPSLYAALDARGAALGAPGHGTIAASGPNFVSLPGYTEIFSGHPPDRCHDNDCAGATGPTLVDAFRDRAAGPGDVAVIASWAPIGRAATRAPSRIVLSVGREDIAGAEVLDEDEATRNVLALGAHADPRPGHGSFRPDRYTSEIALRYLARHEPSFLFVGLGEADEYAHQGDYPGYVGALRAADAFFGRLFETLDGMGERGRRTAVLITADHGRASNYRDHGGALPESARVWLFAIGGAVAARGFVDAAGPRHLADVAPTIRQLVGLPQEDDPRAGTAIGELLGASTAELSRME